MVDAPGPTFRDALDPQYKANRPPMPDELRAQVEPMMEIVAAQGIPILRVPGVEADDVIGTLALRAAPKGIDVVISTGDKDFAQLGAGRAAGEHDERGRLDSDESVVEKFGVHATQIVDYLALMGDKVDNIPASTSAAPRPRPSGWANTNRWMA